MSMLDKMLQGAKEVTLEEDGEGIVVLTTPRLPIWMKVLLEDFVESEEIDGNLLRFSTDEALSVFTRNDSNSSHRYWSKIDDSTYELLEHLTDNYDFFDMKPALSRSIPEDTIV